MFGAQCPFGEGIDLCDRGARHAENPQTTPSKGDPRLERGDAFRAQALDQWERQFRWQGMFHVGQSSRMRGFLPSAT